MVHGADGFAFVLHSDPGGYTTVGNGGKDMGYGGIRKSLAVEFDTWYNPEVGDLFTDHVSIQTSANFPNSVGQGSRMGVPRPVALADGKVHFAKIAYYRFLKVCVLCVCVGVGVGVDVGVGVRVRVGVRVVSVAAAWHNEWNGE